MGMLRRWSAVLIGVALIAVSLPGCLVVSPDTSQIQLDGSGSDTVWRYDRYIDRAYPCAVSGFETFLVLTKIDSTAVDRMPLMVSMHGSGIGWFDATGTPRPSAGQFSSEGYGSLQTAVQTPGLISALRTAPESFRFLSVSDCDRDQYSGTGEPDPNNPHLNADGSLHQTNGLQTTKAAIQYVEDHYNTSQYFLDGIDGGSSGAFYVSYAMQLAGNPPAGAILDSSVVNVEQSLAAFQQGVCATSRFAPAAQAIINNRIDLAVADSNNEIDRMISRREYTVPVLHIWNHGDTDTCGNTPMQCPLRNNTVVTLGATDCNHKPLADAIDALGPTSASKNLPLCVDNDLTPDCSLHVVTTTAGLTNTDPASPTDYMGAVVQWVADRLAPRARYAWGGNTHGQLGDGSTTPESTPEQIGADTDWAFVSTGADHTVAIKSNGTLWAWGGNDAGQLGDGTTTDRLSPVQIGTDTDWMTVSAGGAHTVAIKSNGTLWAWGGNDAGELGDGTTTDRLSPVQIGSDADWVQVSAGGDHTLAIKANTGTLWAWGDNQFGELGDGTTTNQLSPVQIGGQAWIHVAAGDGYSTAKLFAAGVLYAWGRDSSGQLGIGTTSDSSAPVQVDTTTLSVEVAVGEAHMVAMRSPVFNRGGQLWSWGDDTEGQLGGGMSRSSPLQVGTDGEWQALAAGGNHTAALKFDGSLWGWGENLDGEVGNGSTTDQFTPVQIGTAHNWTSVSAGDNYTVALGSP
jgi:alpha-tubulin suppressor-like RCC1 family protein